MITTPLSLPDAKALVLARYGPHAWATLRPGHEQPCEVGVICEGAGWVSGRGATWEEAVAMVEVRIRERAT